MDNIRADDYEERKKWASEHTKMFPPLQKSE